MSSASSPGTCVWTFDGTYWVITSSNCSNGYECAQASSPGGLALTSVNQKVTDAQFRQGLNDAHLMKHGTIADVIPKALTLTKNETYEMDCVKS